MSQVQLSSRWFSYAGCVVAGIALFALLNFTVLPNALARIWRMKDPPLSLFSTSLDIVGLNLSRENTIIVPVRNISWSSVSIVGVRSSCGCIALKGLPLRVEAFDSTFLQFALRPTEDKHSVESNFDLILDSGQEISFQIRASAIGEQDDGARL